MYSNKGEQCLVKEYYEQFRTELPSSLILQNMIDSNKIGSFNIIIFPLFVVPYYRYKKTKKSLENVLAQFNLYNSAFFNERDKQTKSLNFSIRVFSLTCRLIDCLKILINCAEGFCLAIDDPILKANKHKLDVHLSTYSLDILYLMPFENITATVNTIVDYLEKCATCYLFFVTKRQLENIQTDFQSSKKEVLYSLKIIYVVVFIMDEIMHLDNVVFTKSVIKSLDRFYFETKNNFKKNKLEIEEFTRTIKNFMNCFYERTKIQLKMMVLACQMIKENVCVEESQVLLLQTYYTIRDQFFVSSNEKVQHPLSSFYVYSAATKTFILGLKSFENIREKYVVADKIQTSIIGGIHHQFYFTTSFLKILISECKDFRQFLLNPNDMDTLVLFGAVKNFIERKILDIENQEKTYMKCTDWMFAKMSMCCLDAFKHFIVEKVKKTELKKCLQIVEKKMLFDNLLVVFHDILSAGFQHIKNALDLTDKTFRSHLVKLIGMVETNQYLDIEELIHKVPIEMQLTSKDINNINTFSMMFYDKEVLSTNSNVFLCNVLSFSDLKKIKTDICLLPKNKKDVNIRAFVFLMALIRSSKIDPQISPIFMYSRVMSLYVFLERITTTKTIEILWRQLFFVFFVEDGNLIRKGKVRHVQNEDPQLVSLLDNMEKTLVSQIFEMRLEVFKTDYLYSLSNLYFSLTEDIKCPEKIILNKHIASYYAHIMSKVLTKVSTENEFLDIERRLLETNLESENVAQICILTCKIYVKLFECIEMLKLNMKTLSRTKRDFLSDFSYKNQMVQQLKTDLLLFNFLACSFFSTLKDTNLSVLTSMIKVHLRTVVKMVDSCHSCYFPEEADSNRFIPK
ncbi:hypothetical protein EIN_212600, partial [Entamoeba invadens IP1]